MLFSPAVGFALVLPAVGHALSVLFIFPKLLDMLFSRSEYPRCFLPSFLLATGSLSVVPSLIPLTTGSLAVVLSLLPPASLCGSLLAPSTPPLSIKPLSHCCFAVVRQLRCVIASANGAKFSMTGAI